MMKDIKGGCGCAKVGMILVAIGALNWGLVGLGIWFGSDWNVISLVFGSVVFLEALIYVLVGIAGVMMLTGCKCKSCRAGGMKDGGMMGGNSGNDDRGDM